MRVEFNEFNGTRFRGTFVQEGFVATGSMGTRKSTSFAGNRAGERIEWQGQISGKGISRNRVMLITAQEGPYISEVWLIPETDAANPDDIKGVYAISEASKNVFTLTLNADGSAKKSNFATLGRWQGTKDMILVAWTEGWRDMLIRDGAGFRAPGFKPGSSLAGDPTYARTARKE